MKMNRKIRKFAAGILAASMVSGMSVAGVLPVQAAAEKALRVPVVFSGAGWEEEYWNTSNANTVTGLGDSLYQFSDAYKISYQLYIPKPVIQKDGSALLTGATLDLMEDNEEWTWLGWIDTKMQIELINEGGSYVLKYWDEEQQQDVDASKWASVKSSGDYLILTVKELPLQDVMNCDDDQTQPIDTSKEGHINVNINVQGVGTKIQASVYLDNVSISADDKEIAAEDYTTVQGYLAYSINNQPDVETKVSTFTNKLLTLTKTSATIKKGKTVTIKAKAVPTGKITYKSANKKIATVTSKGVVKGVKAGKTTITVTANGVSRKFTVTVTK